MGFNGDFPSTSCAEEDLISPIGDNLPSAARKAWVIGNPPKKSVSVQKRFHSSWNSGNGSSKSADTSTWLFALPGTRSVDHYEDGAALVTHHA
jgi:hypothetical protein